jgi:hypothetical protein
MSWGDVSLGDALQRAQLGYGHVPEMGRAFAAEFGLGMLPGAGLADATGNFPALTNPERTHHPGIWENATQNGLPGIGTALLQSMGAAGDGMMLTGLGAGVGMATKAPRAAQRGVNAATAVRKRYRGNEQTVWNPQRNAYPGVYKDPRVIVREANAQVAPEDPLLKRLWGVTRQDMFDIVRSTPQGARPGEIMGVAANPQGSDFARLVMAPRNEQRLINVLGEAIDTPLGQGMIPWYFMDPMYHKMVQIYGPDLGLSEYNRLNTMTGLFSPVTDVMTEINRGSAARMFANRGQVDDFIRYGGGINEQMRKQGLTRLPGAPIEFDTIRGHAYHSTAHVRPLRKYLEHGRIVSDSPKVPLYTQASASPDLRQADMAVPDAHWVRGTGLPDVRGGESGWGRSATSQEIQTLGPWWRDKVAEPVGLEGVPAQALGWGAFSPQTGVTTDIGAPKLELISKAIGRAAQREGVTPETMRDLYLTGQRHIGHVDPALLFGLAGAGGLGAAGLGGYLYQGEEELPPE